MAGWAKGEDLEKGFLILSECQYYMRDKKTNSTMTRTTLSTLTSLRILIPMIMILATVAIYLNRQKLTASKTPDQTDSTNNPLKITRLGLAREIFLNILLTIPAGLLLPILYRTKHPYLLTAVTVFQLSLLTETFQYFTRLGFAETDDVINNFLGGLLGMGILRIGSIYKTDRQNKKRIIADYK